jgi:hypothetical protein
MLSFSAPTEKEDRMEREAWTELMATLSGLPDRRPRRAQFNNHEIVRVYLWAVLHDRPTCWACDPRSWPGPPRTLPSPSTLSRRLRSLSVRVLLRRLVGSPHGADVLIGLDAKPLRVSRMSKDGQATRGYGAGAIERGYKLHVACDRRGSPIAFDIRPMNEAESVVACRLVSRAARPGSTLLADAAYDSNELHVQAEQRGARLVAPRRKPGRGLGHQPHSAGRLRSIALLEGDPRKRRQAARLRSVVERCFAWLTALGGGHLPVWVRTLPRVRQWILAKLAILAASRRLLMQ